MTGQLATKGIEPPSPFDKRGSTAIARSKALLARVRRGLVRNLLLLAILFMVASFATRSPAFLTLGNFRTLAIQSAVIGIVAVPSALLILSGKVDLSVGSTVALGAVVTGVLLVAEMDPLLASLLGIAAGGAVGIVNGLLVATLEFSPIIVTLGTLTAVRGIAQKVAEQPPFGFPSSFEHLATGAVLGMPIPIVLLAAAFIVGIVVLNVTVGGRHIYAVGVNTEAAYLSGIRTKRIPFMLFLVTGLASGLGGVITAARINAAPAGTIGNGFELDVLTAVLLGGVAFEGGRGSVFGVFLGVGALAILQNGLTLLNVDNDGTLIAKGAVLLVAAVLDSLSTGNNSVVKRLLRPRA